MVATKWLAVTGAAAAGLFALHVIRTRMKRSALENAVGGSPLKRAGKKTMLANRAIKSMKERSQRRRSVDGEGYFAFVSHMKAEAAMEARFLQMELEALNPDELLFLDSDDLRDLTKLISHVEQSRCLILVQTRQVLTRPYCILEALTAITNDIPIVCVTIASKPDAAYNFEEMGQLMQWMDSELEQWNPGAADVLRDHGWSDLSEVAYLLSTTIPKTISVTLNTGASRNVLRATMEDVVAAIDVARAQLKSRDAVPDKASWLAARAKMTRPPPMAPKPSNPAIHAHGAAPPAAVATAAPAVPVAPATGQGLISAAGKFPALLPLAFAVQAMASGATAAVAQPKACAEVAASAEPLERLVLASPKRDDPTVVAQLQATVESLASLESRCVTSDPGAAAFEAAKAALIASVGMLDVSASVEGRAAAGDLAKTLQGLPITPPPPPPPPAASAAAAPLDAAMAGALDAAQRQADAARQQRELLEMQNKVLMEQVAQMQSMMAQQQMSMQTFMQRFPQAPDEAERRLVLLKKRLMDAPRSDFAKVDDVLLNLLISQALGPNCRAVLFNVIGEETTRGLSSALACDDGKIITSDDLPQAMLDERASRKLSMCQYVVASGEYQCFTRHGPSGGKCFMVDFMKKGIDMVNKDPALNEFVSEMKNQDPKFAETFQQMSMMTPLMATQEDVDALPAVKRLATKIHRSMMGGMLSAVGNTNTGRFMSWMVSVFSAEDLCYVGAPVKCEGRTMGSLCTMYTGAPPEGLAEDSEIAEKLKRAAATLSAVLDSL